jgi:hypothetical protein
MMASSVKRNSITSNLRARSVSRTRIVKRSELFSSGESLDPVALLGDLLDKVKDLDIPLGVTVYDDQASQTYLLKTFISREYEVIEDCVKFGLKRLKIKELKVNISFDINVVDEQ